METQEAFEYFIKNCTNTSKSVDKYIGALKKVSETLKTIPESGVSQVWDIDNYENGERIKDLLLKDPVFFEYNNIRGNTMYSAAYVWYLNFLRARDFFSTNKLKRIEENKKDIRNSLTQFSLKNVSKSFLPYFRAMRTKPFLLLAGISGTGKSRIVKEMAFDSCPDCAELRKDPTSPGNYCLVEVKPNWHDSTELLGYESKINGAEYVVTPFVKFLAKAMLHPDIPFFVCLDEMNLAPVEQYFAEFLSVLESRKRVGNTITSEPLIKASIFKDYESNLKPILFDIKSEVKGYTITTTSDDPIHYGKENNVYELLKKQGLRIPPNVVIVGTVNMDETTHQFSRKVIDRAMTIEMNLPEGDPFMDFYNSRELGYRDAPLEASLYLPSKVAASEALKELAENNSGKTEWIKEEIAKILTGLNAQLDGTPFKIAYRTQNELIIYFFEIWRENKNAKWREILTNAVDQILMMKVLPRIQGDEELLEQPLDKLADFCSSYPNATKKIQEMKSRLERAHFTSFWP